jgi:hypothetical protein
MKDNIFVRRAFFAIILIIMLSPPAFGAKVKQGDNVTIITPGTVARLCPHPNCGQNQHITRIPEGIKLQVEGIMKVKSGMMEITWFEVKYKGKRGWISMYDTDKSH